MPRMASCEEQPCRERANVLVAGKHVCYGHYNDIARDLRKAGEQVRAQVTRGRR